MEDAHSVQWSQSGRDGRVANGVGNTVSNIIFAFEKQLQKICTKSKVSSYGNLGATCTIDLPIVVESKTVLSKHIVDPTISSVNLYIVCKKVVKSTDLYQKKRMGIRVSNGLARKKEKPIMQVAHTQNIKTYKSDGRQTQDLLGYSQYSSKY
jgi:hypothetical protein